MPIQEIKNARAKSFSKYYILINLRCVLIVLIFCISDTINSPVLLAVYHENIQI